MSKKIHGFDVSEVGRAATCIALGEAADSAFERECRRLGVDHRNYSPGTSALDLVILASSTSGRAN